ncbi:hypothetical protein Barb4_00643 [Bacteroidales bacterium Barb4]|nr:hypothetical protein Barb4_00643 [Bacteroidales bacterium Barb4]
MVGSRQIIIVLFLGDKEVVLSNGGTGGVLVFVVVVFVIEEVVIIEDNIKPVKGVGETVLPAQFGGVGFLPLVVVAIAEHTVYDLARRICFGVVDGTVAAVVRLVSKQIGGQQVVWRDIVTYQSIKHVHIGTGGGIVVHLRRSCLVSGSLAKTAFAVFAATVEVAGKVELARIPTKSPTTVISLVPTTAQRCLYEPILRRKSG